MNWRDVVFLLTETKVRNDLGDIITKTEERMTYANKKSIRQSEFYQAQATGLRPELAFDVRTIEYDEEELLKFNGIKYNIIRTYDKGEFIELVCQGVVNNRLKYVH